MKKTKLALYMGALTVLTLQTNISLAQTWEWSSGLGTYYYRDNDGRVHYGDGSVSEPSTTWTNSEGKTVYSANSSGPQDKTGQYAIQAPRIDDTNVGAAPSSPPSNYVPVRPGSNGQAVFGGTDPNRIIYVPPNSQGNGTIANNSGAVFGPSQSTPSTSNIPVFGPSQSYQVKIGPTGEYIYYFIGNNGENIYYSK